MNDKRYAEVREYVKVNRFDSPEMITLEEVFNEASWMKHEREVMSETLKRFVTDCSTPLYVLAINAVRLVEKQQAEIDRLKQIIADEKEERRHDKIERSLSE